MNSGSMERVGTRGRGLRRGVRTIGWGVAASAWFATATVMAGGSAIAGAALPIAPPAVLPAASPIASPIAPPVTPPGGATGTTGTNKTDPPDAGDTDTGPGTRAIAPAPVFDPVALFDGAHAEVGRLYPAFELKGVDWDAVAAELRPAAEAAKSPADLGVVLQRMIARLKDANATLGAGSEPAPDVGDDRPFGPGLECRFDADGVFRVVRTVPGGAAQSEGLKPGDAILTIDGEPAKDAVAAFEREAADRRGFSTDHARRHAVIRGYFRTPEVAQWKSLTVDPAGPDPERELDLFSMMIEPIVPAFSLPEGLNGPGGPTGPVAWAALGDSIGYLRITTIGDGLDGALDQAVNDLTQLPSLIVDLRGTGGDPFDPATAFLNFDAEGMGEGGIDGDEFDAPVRPIYDGTMILLVDAGTIGAGETWLSWFAATRRARIMGSATAGAAARVKEVPLAGGRWIATIPTRHYRGFLGADERIEGRGIIPDIVVEPTVEDLVEGRDGVLERAKQELDRVQSIG
ncbi:MAG: S41 family peptidase [Phycisphaerales bacterium]